ncbi:hypothetical protein GPL21_14680 [Bradyrhizobium pachyrhizi]|uniref:Uncharacterized protein n=1 Tax=Bradyrhizobium pachyrhizi TaxID=280333 RepID=A0A844SGK3_9BRAD|nr:hypothetical protein [Bradyrhizobium pachyrhizi]MVT66343.1 hypothetical protein [Bradyrhizobium pachyrhizi]WFU56919.1 hypothetical protein QA639_05175 [Bradyrhizobium pachyrhizi]
MVREGPAEPAPASTAETTQGRQVRPYGMMITSAIIALAVIVIVYVLMR